MLHLTFVNSAGLFFLPMNGLVVFLFERVHGDLYHDRCVLLDLLFGSSCIMLRLWRFNFEWSRVRV